ncbi:MAG: 16S rRNA (guanine(966)-N(2))-methyltransferase RsmD [Gammaproteobacteria bacterium]|nr:MAG: 16S rRNA (guanine(966)-N(2))-methyltransferase RsmD [Gammaproteobacteria bacterium]
MPRKSKSKKPTKPTSQLKIIAGQWRGRNVQFLQLDGVRPTPSRIRETLFNWLAPSIRGATCLDVFAGSGILGIEALSRGAKSCTFIDQSGPICKQIGEQLSILDADSQKTVFRDDAKAWLRSLKPESQYDVIFLDPPFNQNLLPALLNIIAEQGLLSSSGCIYAESEAPIDSNPLPSHWQLTHSKSAGDVHYGLIFNTPQ